MTGTLIRRHPLVRELPKTLLASLVTAGLSANVFGLVKAHAVRTGGGPSAGLLLPALEALILLSLAGLVAKGSIGVRCREWEASLPETARRLWLAHWGAASLVAAVLTVVSGAMVLGLTHLVMRTLDVPQPGGFALARVVAEPLLLALALAAVAAAWRPGSARPDRLPGWRRRGAAALLAALAALLVAQKAVWLTPLLLAVAVAAALRAGRALGPALDWIGSADGDGAPVDQDAGAWQAAPSRRVAWLAVGRQLSKWPMSLALGLPMAALFGLLLGGWTPSGDDEAALRWSNVAMCAYILLAFSGHFLENLRRVDHLPISRRVLLAWLLVPGMGALVAGYGAARLWETAESAAQTLEVFAFDGGADGAGLRVPPALWRLTTAAEAPVVTAPWGESVTARTVPLLRGGPLRLWKPYTAPPEASPRFAAWQLARAAADWYGVGDVSKVHLLASDLFEPGDDGRTRASREDFSRALGLGGRGASGGPVFPVLMGAAFVLTLAAVAVYCTAFRAGATLVRTRVVFWSLMAGLLALHLGGLWLLVGKAVEEWAVSGALFGALRRLGGPGSPGWAAAWAVSLLLVAGAWRAAAGTFSRVEALKDGGRGCS
jgi:hypothetical protein